jgi:hypothetical protein
MRILALALAASSMLAAVPAMAASPYTQPPGKDPKVCLLTFDSATERNDVNVTKAQYVPLQIAAKLETRNDDYMDAFVYGTTDPEIEGTTWAYDTRTTEETCAYLADLADDADEDDD